ncbi:MAG: hypothetical protein F4153_02960 [Acidimicrobiia bacterium]|nr:hypothetical protein [Acidimicrobiia bacterium]
MTLSNPIRLTPRRSAVLAALAYAFVPLTVKSTASNANPFYFNLISKVAQVPVIVLALWLLYRLYFQKGELSIKRLLGSSHTYLVTYDSGGDSGPAKLRNVLKTPIFWLTISFFDYTLFTWSTHYVDAAISAAIFELWPIIFVATLILTQRSSNLSTQVNPNRRTMRAHDWILISLAPLGLFLVFISQAEDLDSLLEIGLSDTIIGTTLALSAAILSGIAPSMTILYGEQLYLNHQRNAQSSFDHGTSLGESSVADRDRSDKQLWFTLLGFAISILLSTFYNVVVGLSVRVDQPAVTLESFYGGIILGAVLLAPAAVLLRKANHDSQDASVNGIFFFAPVLALLLLFSVDIGITRLDVFAIGAALILVVNILIQANPDRESDVTVFGERPMHGNRMGFTTMILTLWFFGAAIYLRDDLLPSEWLKWQGPDYWGVVALSATVFALIFGFRVARLTTRINREDEAMLELFRRFEHLLMSPNQGILDPNVIHHLRNLDRASPSRRIFQRPSPQSRHPGIAERSGSEAADRHHTRMNVYGTSGELDFRGELFQSYAAVRRCLRDARERCMSLDESAQRPPDMLQELNYLEWQLDVVTHSKQQGRDFSELMSLMIFAAVTVFLAVGARPSSVEFPTAGWSGFLTEVFVMLFVSTIAFLAVNLLDIRRDREIPLIVGLDRSMGDLLVGHDQQNSGGALPHGEMQPERTDGGETAVGAAEEVDDRGLIAEKDHILFFRLRRDLTGQRVVAVLVTLALCALYSALLYDKWL